jgi:hypothetical protein
MQPTQTQVERSLEALRTPVDATMASANPSPDIPDSLLDALRGAPAVRADRLEQARQRLAAGEQPSADDLARRMVGRLVCDRLR